MSPRRNFTELLFSPMPYRLTYGWCALGIRRASLLYTVWTGLFVPPYRLTYGWCALGIRRATFETEVVKLLSRCLEEQHSKPRVRREKMWSTYHMLRVSEEYKSAWNSFLAQSGCSVLPLFCQHVGHYIFKELIKKHHSTESTKHKEMSFNPTYEELNGIRYAAG